MRIVEIKERSPLLIEQLLKVWESSVKATHLFLSDNEINNIKQYVLLALKDIPVLVVAENEGGVPVGFMGTGDVVYCKRKQRAKYGKTAVAIRHQKIFGKQTCRQRAESARQRIL